MLVAAAAGALAQPQTFKTGVTLVTIDAIVTDADGFPVGDLTKDDFAIVDNGRAKPVASAAFVDLRSTRSLPHAAFTDNIRPDVWTNEGADRRRYFAIVLDDLDTHPEDAIRARDVAERFVRNALGPDDMVALVFTSRGTDPQEFTPDKNRLLARIDSFTGAPPAGAIAEIDANFTRVFGTLKSMAAWLQQLPQGRKSIVFVTSGLPVSTKDLLNPAVNDLLSRASLANIAFYPIDLLGITPPRSVSPGGITSAVPNARRGVPPASGDPLSPLRVMADGTGGIAVVDSNGFDRRYRQIVQDASAYYLLGYDPPPDDKATTHTIEVRVKRPHLSVRARRTYAVDPNAGATRTLSDVVASPVAAGSWPLAVQSAAFQTANERWLVLVTLEMSATPIVSDDSSSPSFVYDVSAVDSTGKIVAKDGKRTAVRRGGYQGIRVAAKLDLPGGGYRLRTAVMSSDGSADGSVPFDIDLPQIDGASISMSDVLLTSSAAATLPSAPSVVRRFSGRDAIAVYAEAYERGTAPVTATATLVARRTGQSVREVAVHAANGKGIGGAAATTLKAEMPLNDLAAGEYLLTLRATSGDHTTSRAIPIAIRTSD